MEQRRKGEAEGKRLTPGERAINWAKAFAIIVPLFGAGYFADDTIRFVQQEEEPQVDIEPTIPEAVVEDAPDAPTRVVERTIIRERDCGISEALVQFEERHKLELH